MPLPLTPPERCDISGEFHVLGDEANLIEPTHEIYTGADPSNLHQMSYLEGVFLKKDRKAPVIA